MDLLAEQQSTKQMRTETHIHKQRDSLVKQERTEDKYIHLYQHAPIGLASFDNKGNIQEINSIACQILGYESLVLLDKPFSIFLSLKDTAAFFTHIREVASSANKVRTQLTVRSRKGKVYRLQLESVCYTNSNGENIIQSALIDVSEPITSEHAVPQSDHQFNLIIDALPILIAYLDSDMRYIFTNEAHDITFPLKENYYIGKHLIDVIGDNAYATIYPYIKSGLNGHEVSCELTINTPSGIGDYVVNIIPNASDSATTTGLFLIMNDVSMLKQKEVDVMKHLTTLAHEARIHLIGQMTSEIAHEINQPLATIANYSAAGLRLHRTGKLQNEDISEIFFEIDNQIQRASQIIRHLKKFSQNRNLNCQNTNINSLIEDTLQLMVAEKHWSGIHIETELSARKPIAFADGILIEQVLLNLIRNAIEALSEMKDHHGLISIKTQNEEDSIFILIADNGPGLSHEMLNKIFTPFFSTKESGVGLGLSICNSIIDSHNGKLWATRNENQGTIFHVQLPLSKAA